MSDLAKHAAELGPEQSRINTALDMFRGVTIADDATHTWAVDALKEAKARGKALEEKRVEITRPILTAKAGVDNLFKPLIGLYEQAETILKSKIAEYANRREQERRAAMTASAAEYQSGGTPTMIIPEPAKVGGISVTKVWDFEVTDEASIPREFCSPDPRKLRAWMALAGPGNAPHAVPGVTFVQRDRVAVRGGK